MDLASDNLLWLICHKTKSNQTKSSSIGLGGISREKSETKMNQGHFFVLLMA